MWKTEIIFPKMKNVLVDWVEDQYSYHTPFSQLICSQVLFGSTRANKVMSMKSKSLKHLQVYKYLKVESVDYENKRGKTWCWKGIDLREVKKSWEVDKIKIYCIT